MKVKKIAALAVGAAMVGATIGLASAQSCNVPDIPKDFFVQNGQPNVKIVVGSNAAALDVASAADIAVALGSLLYTEKQVEVQGDYVKIKKEIPPATIYKEVIYAYDYTTMTEDHGLSDLSGWATKYEELLGDYWYNGAGVYNFTYDEWKDRFNITAVEIEDKDTVNGHGVDWEVTIKKVELESIKPASWDKTAPPKKANILISPGNIVVFLDYRLFKYTVNYKYTDPEWGITISNSTSYVGDADDEADAINYVPDGAELVSVTKKEIVRGIRDGSDFTIFNKKYHVYKVEKDKFIVGNFDEDWFELEKEKPVGDFTVTIQDINLDQKSVLALIKDKLGNSVSVMFNTTNPVYIYYNDDGKLDWTYEQLENAELMLELKGTFVGINNKVMARVKYVTDMKPYTNNFHPIEGWNATFSTYQYNGKWYIANITLVNNELKDQNPIDILGVYDLVYDFDLHTKSEKTVKRDINGDGDKGDTLVTAYAYIYLKEKKGKVVEKELKIGDEVLNTGYTVEGIHATATTIVINPVTSRITLMDYEVDVNDPGSNLILVGGPVANSVTKYLVDEGKSQVDWYNSPGDVEYIPDAFGEYGAVIVAGATRNETRAAAKCLMDYLAKLAKE